MRLPGGSAAGGLAVYLPAPSLRPQASLVRHSLRAWRSVASATASGLGGRSEGSQTVTVSGLGASPLQPGLAVGRKDLSLRAWHAVGRKDLSLRAWHARALPPGIARGHEDRRLGGAVRVERLGPRTAATCAGGAGQASAAVATSAAAGWGASSGAGRSTVVGEASAMAGARHRDGEFRFFASGGRRPAHERRRQGPLLGRRLLRR